ncbi:hypothetical protein KUCAC02_020143, partial [Chaenocephalus aceratus]
VSPGSGERGDLYSDTEQNPTRTLMDGPDLALQGKTFLNIASGLNVEPNASHNCEQSLCSCRSLREPTGFSGSSSPSPHQLVEPPNASHQ